LGGGGGGGEGRDFLEPSGEKVKNLASLMEGEGGPAVGRRSTITTKKNKGGGKEKREKKGP